MGETTGISWTEKSWNPWVGCTKVSPGCFHCYAERGVEVFPMAKGKGAFRKLNRTQTWADPIKWNRLAFVAGKRALVFTCSYSDFFHEAADQWRDEAWAIIRDTPNLEWQILTKRPDRIKDHLPADWGSRGYPNVWLGTSVENQKYAEARIPHLLVVPAKIHFLSCEPLLGPLNLRELKGPVAPYDALTKTSAADDRTISWVIVGGESGKEFRYMQTQWAIEIKAQCAVAGVPFFGKQRSGPTNELPLIIEGREWKAFPAGFERRTGKGQQTLLAEGAAP